MQMKRNLLVTSTLGLFIPAAVLSQQDEPVHDFQVALRATPLEKGSLFTKVSNISLPNGNWKGVANGISIWTGYLKNGRLHNDWQSWYVMESPWMQVNWSMDTLRVNGNTGILADNCGQSVTIAMINYKG